jgi:rRNA processing protein Gar1
MGDYLMEKFLPLLCLVPLMFGVLLSIKQVAKILGIKVASVHSLIQRDQLKAERIGESRELFVQEKEVDRYQQERRLPGRPKKKERSSQ